MSRSVLPPGEDQKTSGVNPAAHDPAAVHRVCQITKGECKYCPLAFEDHGETYVHGCVAIAEEIINVVETGNPWRKTDKVKAPWTILSKALGQEGATHE